MNSTHSPRHLFLLLLSLLASHGLWAQPSNDDLCSASPLTIGATCNGLPNADNSASTYQLNEPVASCFNAGAGSGTIWFSFVAPASGKVRISTDIDVSGTNNDTELALYSLTNNDCSDLNNLVELDCDQDGGTVVIYPGGGPADTYMSVLEYQGLTVGLTYYIQVGSYDGVDLGTFCIEIAELITPANDNLCDAQFLTVGASCVGMPNGNNTSATNQSGEPIPDCTSGLVNTVWFQFVAPPSGFITIDTDVAVGGSNTASTIALYELPTFPGACANPSLLCEIICASDNGTEGARIEGAKVNPGETYYVQVARGNPPSGNGGSFCLEITDPGAIVPPVNDELCSAVPLTVGASCNGIPNGSNQFATQACDETAPPCFEGGLNSVWFSFVAPQAGVVNINTNLDSAGATLTNSELGLYLLSAPSCSDFSSLTFITCDSDAANGALPGNAALINQLVTPGETYYVQVSGFLSAVGDFCITVDSVSPPSNDDLCDAVPLTLGASCNGVLNGDNSLASSQVGEPTASCFIGAANSVWYSFVAPPSGEVTVSTDVPTTGSNGDTEVALYSLTGGDCTQPTNLVELGCSQDVDPNNLNFLSALTVSGLTAGETFYVQVSGWQNTQGSFCLEIIDGTPGPSNDQVCDAIALPVDGQVRTFSNQLATVTVGETDSLMAPPLGSGIDGFSWDENEFQHSVWFTFVAPSTSALSIDLCNEDAPGSTNFDTQVAVYAASTCLPLASFELVGANDDLPNGCDANDLFASYLELTCLTPGQTYYILVDGWDGEEGDFGISLTEVPAGPPLSADIFSVDPACGEANNGLISVNLAQGAPPYEFTWENSASVLYRG
ncbi:MAG: hypothetical protein AAF804_06330, partial [Bacteroidota bacterium]